VLDILQRSPLFPQSAEGDMERQVELERKAGDALSAVVTRLTGRPTEELGVHVAVGSADAAIVRHAESRGVNLLVVGATGRTGRPRLWLGSTAERVVRHAHGSVLVARHSPRSGCVLAATDLSDPALPGVQAAAEEAKRRNANLTVLHALDVGSGV